MEPGLVPHAFNLSTWAAESGSFCALKNSQGNIVRPCLQKNGKKKIKFYEVCKNRHPLNSVPYKYSKTRSFKTCVLYVKSCFARL